MKRHALSLAFFMILGATAQAQYYPGSQVKAHAHSTPPDGGTISTLKTNRITPLYPHNSSGYPGISEYTYSLVFSSQALYPATVVALSSQTKGQLDLITNPGFAWIPIGVSDQFVLGYASSPTYGAYQPTANYTGRGFANLVVDAQGTATFGAYTQVEFKKAPTINGVVISTNAVGSDTTKIFRNPLYDGTQSVTVASATITGNSFSVGGSTLVVANGRVGMGAVHSGSVRVLEITGNMRLNGTAPVIDFGNDFVNQFYRDASNGYVLQENNVITSKFKSDGITFPLASFSVGTSTFSCSAGKCGVGTNAPNAKLEVAGGPFRVTGNGMGGLGGSGVEVDYEGGGANTGRVMAYDRTGGAYKDLILGSSLRVNGDGSFTVGTSTLVVANGGANFASNTLVVNPVGYVGRVGIGVATPSTILHVSSGTIKVDGTGAAIALGGKTQTIGYAPVRASSASVDTATLGASRLCISSFTLTQFGGRYLQIAGLYQLAQAGAPATITAWIERNGVALSSNTINATVGDSEPFPLSYSTTNSASGVNTYAFCAISTAGTSIIPNHNWSARED